MSFAARATFVVLQISWSGLLLSLAPPTLSAQDTTGWQLVWSDEFNGSANSPPDRTKWNYDIGTGPIPGWGNNELETYTDSTDNAFQDGNGNLVIRALNTGNGYTSSRIKTQDKFSFKYGMVTARIKIPYAQGIWPAFWMLGATYPTVRWPDCGEIDIMENFGVRNGDASVNHGTLHGPGDTGVGITSIYTLPNGQKLSDDFHVFSVEWTTQGVAFFVDGTLYSNITSARMPAGWQSPLANSFFMILNVAVGGSPAPVGAPDATTIFPQQMLVDYVRVYQPLALATRFVPILPCRVADTRYAAGSFGGPAIAGQTSRDFVIPNGACGIPSNAAAYSLNVAVVPAGLLGYLTLWPTGQPRPLVATLNSDGRIKSNAAIMPAGTNGAISVFATDTTDVVLDIDGYFVSAIDTSPLEFYPVTPCRMVDTRNPTGLLGSPNLVAHSSRTFPLLDSSCTIPTSARAYSLNFTAVPKGPLGYLTVWPSGQPQPLSASLNASTAVTTANAVVVAAGENGDVDVFASDDTDLAIDINGYFALPGAGGLSLYVDVPCRVLDTRESSGPPPFGTARDVNVTSGPCGASVRAQAFVFNATVVPPGFLGSIKMWPQGEPQPLVATLGVSDQAITSNMAIVSTANGSITVFPSDPTDLVLDIFGFFAP